MMKFVRRIVQKCFQQFGLELVTSHRAYKAGLRPDIARLIALHKPGTVIDVGANEGQFRDFLRKSCGFDGRIISFEPIPSLAAQLEKRSATDLEWTVVPKALGAKSAVLELNVSLQSDFSSFLSFSDQGRLLFPGAEKNTTANVPVTTLMEFLAAEKLTLPFFLKLDTQGFDLEVLKGAGKEFIDQCAILLCEVSVIPIYDGQPNWRHVLTLFDEFGFDLVGLYPVNRTGSMQVIEFDCLMVNHHFTAASPK